MQVLYRRWVFSPRQVTREEMQPLVSFQSRHLPDDGNGVLAYTIATHKQMGWYGLPSAGMCYAMSELSPQVSSPPGVSGSCGGFA